MATIRFGLAIPLLLLAAVANAQPGKVEATEAGKAAATKVGEMSAQEFLTTTAEANQFEIDASKLAVQQSKKKEVKDLAEALVADHVAAAEKLKAAVRTDAKLALPARDVPNDKHARILDELKGAFGDAFDRAYLEAMFSGHQEALERYKNYAASGDNAALRMFADEVAPVIERHLSRVRGMLGP